MSHGLDAARTHTFASPCTIGGSGMSSTFRLSRLLLKALMRLAFTSELLKTHIPIPHVRC